MTQNFDEQISSKNEQLDSIKNEMEAIKNRFIQEVIPVVSALYEPAVKKVLRENADVASQLTDDQLREIKNEVIRLKENAEATVTEEFSNPNIWWHLTGNVKAEYSPYGNREPKTIEKPLHYAVGRIAPLLEKYSLLKTNVLQPMEYHFVWREWDSTGNRKNLSGKPFYPVHIDYSNEMTDLLKKYMDKKIEANKLIKEIESLNEEKSKHNVLDRWDSI